MFSVKRGNRFQLGAIAYFILGNLLFEIFLILTGVQITIISNILVSQLLFVGGAALIYTLLSPGIKAKDFYIKPLSIVDALICIAIAWMIMPLLSFINVLSQFFVQNQIQDAIVDMVALPYLITILLTAVSPAVLEELLSRSIILRNYQSKPVLTACLASGMFFGFIHLNINQFLYAFVMGAIMAYIVMVTGSIFSSMIIHFVINASGTTTLYLISWVSSLFENSDILMDELMSTAAPTTSELLLSTFVIFGVALLFTPVALLLIRLLSSRHNKPFKGSFKMIASEFLAVGQGSTNLDFNEIMAAEKVENNYLPPLQEEKVWTPALIASVVLFTGFALMIEMQM